MSARMYDLNYVLSCLNRCEHGRHEGDSCYGCPGEISKGTPLADTIRAQLAVCEPVSRLDVRDRRSA